jgi:hypothetical protein
MPSLSHWSTAGARLGAVDPIPVNRPGWRLQVVLESSRRRRVRCATGGSWGSDDRHTACNETADTGDHHHILLSGNNGHGPGTTGANRNPRAWSAAQPGLVGIVLNCGLVIASS